MPRNITKSIVNGMFVCFFLFFGKSTLTVNFYSVGVQVNVLLNVNQLREFLSIFKIVSDHILQSFLNHPVLQSSGFHNAVLKIYL